MNFKSKSQFLFFFSLQLVFANVMISQSDPMWSVPISDKSFSFFQDGAGNVIITEKGVAKSLNPNSGEQNWSIDSGSKKVTVNGINGTPLAVLTGSGLKLIDMITGKVLLDEEGDDTKYKGHQLYGSKNKLIVDYTKSDKDMIAIIDLEDYGNSVISEMKTKGGFFSGELRAPSDIGTVFKNKKILSCLNMSGDISSYDSGEKSMQIIGTTQAGVATIMIKYKKFIGINMSNCEVVWEYQADKQPFYNIDEASNVLFLIKKKTLNAFDMDTGEKLYTLEENKAFFGPPFFYDNVMYTRVGGMFKKIDSRTGELLAEKEMNLSGEGMYVKGNEFFVNYDGDLNKMDPNTLNLKWDEELDGTNIVWQGESNGDTYYLISEDESFKLYSYKDDRTRNWDRKIDGVSLKDVVITDVGVIVATEKEFLLVKNSDGKKMWSYKSKFNYGGYVSEQHKRYYGIVNSYSFYVDMKTGEFKSLPKFKLKNFDENKLQSHILVKDDVYIMKSGNNFYIRDLEGGEIITKHYKPHSNASKWAKIGSIAAATTAVATGNAEEIVQVSDGAGNVIHEGSLYNSDSYGNYLKESRERIANSSDLNLPFVFTKDDDKNKVFIFLDPLTGEEYKAIVIKENEPTYIVDTYDGILFYENTKTKMLEAHGL